MTTGPTTEPSTHTEGSTSLGLRTMTMMVVGSMVGAGVFSLPAQFAAETGVAGTLLSWAVAGGGMFMFALVLQNLAVRRPHLDAGIYAYAKAGFGDFFGFLSAAGYWASACVANVTYWVLITSTLGAVFPALGEGDTWLAVVVSSVGLWLYFLLLRKGVREAAGLNRVVTIAKVVPIVVFVVLALFALDTQVLADNWAGAEGTGSLFDQVRGTMLATIFVFLGVEGASVFSRHARRRRDVGRATVMGFLSVLAVFASVTIVSFGILPAEEIAGLREPSMAGVLEAAYGSWGATFVNVGLLASVLGAYLTWSLIAAEVLFVAARDDDMPRFLRRTTNDDVPVAALALTSLLTQVVLVLTLLSEDAFNFTLDMTSTLAILPYLLAAAYGLKLVLTREAYASDERRTGALVVAAIATTYTAFLVYAAGLTYLLLSFLFYAPATVLFVMARREQGRRLFSPRELLVLLVVVAVAVAAVVGLATGSITL